MLYIAFLLHCFVVEALYFCLSVREKNHTTTYENGAK